MIVQHNIASLNAWRNLYATNQGISKSMEKLSSGYRINRAADDAAGLSISEKMRGQIRGLNMAVKNAQDGISLIQTGEGALNEVHAILNRMRELATQSTNGTNTEEDRAALQQEFSELKQELDRIANTTEFNTKKLLNGNLKGSGVLSGSNEIVGAAVLKQTKAQADGTAALNAGDYSTLDFAGGNASEQITVDGHVITVDWANKLTASEQTVLDADYSTTSATADQVATIKSALERVINESIDEYNATNQAGANVAHVRVYENAAGNLVVESGIAGEESGLVSAAGTVLATYLGAGLPATGVFGDNELQTDINGTLQFRINGVTLLTDPANPLAALAGDSGDDVARNASGTYVNPNLETLINTAIDTYNTNAGLSQGDDGYIENVVVDADNGRFVISSPSGPITFLEQEGYTTVEDLGLLQTQTELAAQGGVTLQIGANRGQTLTFGIGDLRVAALGLSGSEIGTAESASLAIDSIDDAVGTVSTQRSKLGAMQNRLEHTINNLQVAGENLQAAESRIRDVDVADEMANFTKQQILLQAGTAMLAQANAVPQTVLQLLR